VTRTKSNFGLFGRFYAGLRILVGLVLSMHIRGYEGGYANDYADGRVNVYGQPYCEGQPNG